MNSPLRWAAVAAALLCARPALAVPTFAKESGAVQGVAGATAFTGATGAGAYAPLRMYYVTATSSAMPHFSSGTTVLSANSTDGLVFAADAGVRLSTVTSPSVSASSITGISVGALTAGGFRMVYSIVSTTGAWRIHHATSADGLLWANQSSVIVDGGTSFVGSPALVTLNSGDWRLYYTRDTFGGGDDLSDRRIWTARSTDEGATWGASTLLVSTVAYEVGATKLTDGKVRLYYTQPVAGLSSATLVLSQLSSDALGTSFSLETGVRLSTNGVDGGMAFPTVIRATDTFRWRMYYSFYAVARTTGDVYTALTSLPAPTNFLPGSAYNTSAAASFSMTGEVFSAAPTVQLKQGALTIAGTGVVRADDQNISATFNTQNQTLGYYDLVVTNADGNTRTMTNAFYLDFPPGVVTMTNNLLRPRSGGTTTIDVTVFTPGRTTVIVRNAEGRSLRTLFDGDLPAGTTTFNWDGKDSSGALQASGVYLVTVVGPKLNTKSKVVLIK